MTLDFWANGSPPPWEKIARTPVSNSLVFTGVIKKMHFDLRARRLPGTVKLPY